MSVRVCWFLQPLPCYEVCTSENQTCVYVSASLLGVVCWGGRIFHGVVPFQVHLSNCNIIGSLLLVRAGDWGETPDTHIRWEQIRVSFFDYPR